MPVRLGNWDLVLGQLDSIDALFWREEVGRW